MPQKAEQVPTRILTEGHQFTYPVSWFFFQEPPNNTGMPISHGFLVLAVILSIQLIKLSLGSHVIFARRHI